MNSMEPWKKVANIEPSFNSKSDKARELESDMDTFNMLAILDKLNQNNGSNSNDLSNKEDIDSLEKNIESKFEYKQSKVESSNEQQLENRDEILEEINNNNSDINTVAENNSFDKAKKDTVSDTDKKQIANEKTTNKDNNFLDRIYSLIKLKRETQEDSKRDTSPGYAVNKEGKVQVPDSIIRTLITKFLNQRFLTQDSDLNSRSDSFNKSNGFYEWDNKNIAIHLKTNQFQQILMDKYGYDYEAGENQSIPLSFYFDLSGSMCNYTNILSVIAIELLKKNVKVLIGFNQNVQYQIDKLQEDITIDEFTEILKNTSKYYTDNKDTKKRIEIKSINSNIDNYLLDKKAEKCVVFSDYDALREIIKLSDFCQTYYFCFEDEPEMYKLDEYKGFFYNVSCVNDMVDGLIKINDISFEAIRYAQASKKKIL